MRRLWIFVLIVLTLTGGTAAVAQSDDESRVTMPRQVVELRYGSTVYEIDPQDGPVLAIVESRLETVAGVEIRGVVVIRDDGGYRVAGTFVDPAPSVYDWAAPDDVLVLSGHVGVSE